MSSALQESFLRYAQSGQRVQLGDRVEFRSLILRRPRAGTVVCIPELTGRERLSLGKETQEWLIKLDSEVVTGWLYSPEDLQPPSRLRLISRASGNVVEMSNDDVERLEEAEEARAGWLELAAPPLILLVLVAVVLVAIGLAFGVGT